MTPSLPILAGMLVLLAGPAAHAFTIEPLDSSSARAALAEGPSSPLTSHDDGKGNVTTHFGDSESSLSFGSEWHSSQRPGYQMPLIPDPAWPPRESGGRE
jgi:hypothetical protein